MQIEYWWGTSQKKITLKFEKGMEG